MEIKKEKFITADGSHTFYMAEINEYYHSHHGAIQEARHVFIKNGFHFFESENEFSILEVGFGTGLNALLTCLEAEKSNKKITYFALEAYPLSEEELTDLNYSTQLEEKNAHILYQKIHQANWGEMTKISPTFKIIKLKEKIQELKLELNSIDLIYFDAFGPRVQPEMWSLEIFSKIFSLAKEKACFVTYCAKGQVKRDLKSAGFQVETLQGPPGKREMIRGLKN
ncbi:MAG: tRNA (5-methylaminomethyl-2-thiouridine)(34)-methyltransferase MnmD [Bacteroidota bacterium]